MPIAHPHAHTHSRPSPVSLAALAGIACSVLASSASAQTTFDWTNLAGGSWHDAANWSPAGIPGGSDTALLGGASAYVVDVTTTDGNFADLVFSNASATVAIHAGRSVFNNGSASGPGLIVVNADQIDSTSNFYFIGSSLVFDSTLMLNANPGAGVPLNRARVANWTGTGRTFGANSLITGSGQIAVSADNLGQILAASPSDIIEFKNSITQSGAGQIRAQSGGTLIFTSGTISGGSIVVEPGGSTQAANATIADTTLTGEFGIQSSGHIFVTGAIDGTGTFNVNTDQGSSASNLYFIGNDAIYDANIRLNADPGAGVPLNLARVANWTGTGRTFGPNAKVSGTGQILVTNANEGVFVAESGDTLEIKANTDQANGGEIRAQAGGKVIFATGTITEGDIIVDAGGSTDATGGTINGSTLTGELGMTSGGHIFATGDIDGTGTFNVNTDQGLTVSNFYFTGSDAVYDANIRLNANPGAGVPLSAARVANWTGTGRTFGPSAQVSGTGQIIVTNANEGVFVAESGDTLEIKANTDQTNGGEIRAQAGGTVIFATGTITDGDIVVDAGGSTDATGGTINGSTLTGELGMTSGGHIFIAGSIDGTGTFNVNTDQGATVSNFYFTGSDAVYDANIRLNANPGAGVPLSSAKISNWTGTGRTFGPNATISGNGQLGIGGTNTNNGTISPGHSASPIGEILTANTHVLTSTANIDIQLGGDVAADFDRITGTSTITLDGALNVSYVNGYVPSGDEQLAVIDVTTVIGEFASVTFAQYLSPTGPEHIAYTNNQVLVVMCYADCDASGSLNILDYICFGDGFSISDTYADCDLSGSLNILDYICFGDAFATGCP